MTSRYGGYGGAVLARRVIVLLVLVVVITCQREPMWWALGNVVAIDDARLHVTLDHEAIPGLMGAMTMRFPVASPEVLAGIQVGDRVNFTLRRRGAEPIVTSVTLTARTKAPAAASTGVHDHTPHHGGIVGMSGMLHLEALVAPDGALRVYLTDFWRNPRPLDGVTGAVTLELPEGDRELPLHLAADHLEAAASPLPGPEVSAHFALTVDGEPAEMDFLLPVGPAGGGAAGVPIHGCVPAAARGAARAPRCTLDFARPIAVVAATPDGATALVAAVDLGVSAWHMPAGSLALGFAPPPPLTVPGPEGRQIHSEVANAIAVSPDGREAVVALEGRLLRHRLADGGLVRELPAPRGVLRSVAWSPDGATLLVTAFYDASAHLLRAEDGAELRRLPVEREGALVAFAPDGRLAAVGSELGPVTLYDLAGDAPPRTIGESSAAPSALAFTGDRLLTGGRDGVLRVWDTATATAILQTPPGPPILALAVAPGGRLAASIGLDAVVQLLDPASGATIERLAWHTNQVLGVAWAGKVLVSADADGHLALWDVGAPQ